jgi:phosphatidylserine decarboxylase
MIIFAGGNVKGTPMNLLRSYPNILVPQKILTWLVGKLFSIRAPFFKNRLLRWYADYYQVDLSEAVRTNLEDYANFNDFFTRALRADARPIEQGSNQLVAPADGILYQQQAITKRSLFSAKGQGYSLRALLAEPFSCLPYQKGHMLAIYLAPKDYHRVHMPVAGKLVSMKYIPGKLFSVKPRTLSNIPDIFARNSRLICNFDTEHGKMAVIMVGALIVASIRTTWAGLVHSKSVQEWSYSDQEIHLAQGEELGAFELGSTVIVLFEHEAEKCAEILIGQQLRMGQRLATFVES